MKRLIRCIVYEEVIYKKPNCLFQINIGSSSIQGVRSFQSKEKVLAETLRNRALRHAICSGIINCALPEQQLRTPFYATCETGGYEVFRYFLEYEPNVNMCDAARNTCVHAALRVENMQIVAELLAMNANCTVPNSSGETPLMLACSKQLTPLALALIDVFYYDNKLTRRKPTQQIRLKIRRHSLYLVNMA